MWSMWWNDCRTATVVKKSHFFRHSSIASRQCPYVVEKPTQPCNCSELVMTVNKQCFAGRQQRVGDYWSAEDCKVTQQWLKTHKCINPMVPASTTHLPCILCSFSPLSNSNSVARQLRRACQNTDLFRSKLNFENWIKRTFYCFFTSLNRKVQPQLTKQWEVNDNKECTPTHYYKIN